MGQTPFCTVFQFQRPILFVIDKIPLCIHAILCLHKVFLNFYKLWKGELTTLGEPILQNDWIIWPPLLYSNFNNLNDPNSLSFISYQCILHESGALFSVFWDLLKLKRGDLISLMTPILQNDWIIWHPFCISILKIWTVQILCHSSHNNAFYMNQEYFSQFFEICSN